MTTLFCFIIALLTQTLWEADFHIHILISFGYGYIALLSERALRHYFFTLSTLTLNIIALLSALIFGSINAFYWLINYPGFSSFKSFSSIIFLAGMFSVICLYFFYINEQKTLTEQALETAKRKQLEQEKTLILSQLNQLQSQIEPHFLFNTLANIRALIEFDNSKAIIMLEKLTELLRGTLNANRLSLTSLTKETELLSAYLDIQKIRLGDRLKYQINNNVDILISLPPFLIQPLVENAIQHGIEASIKGGEVIISYNIIENTLIINISDSGLGIQETNSTKGNGISLNNIHDRLASLFEKQASLSISENSKGGVNSVISIPLAQLNKLQEGHI